MPCFGNSLSPRFVRSAGFVPVLCALLLLGGAGRVARAADVKKEFQDKYREIYANVDAARLQQTVQDLGKFKSRVAGYPDSDKAADYVKAQFQQILGPGSVQEDTYHITVPYDPGVDDPAKGAYVQAMPTPGDATAGRSAGGAADVSALAQPGPHPDPARQRPDRSPHLRQRRQTPQLQRQGCGRRHRHGRLQLRGGVDERSPPRRESRHLRRPDRHDAR